MGLQKHPKYDGNPCKRCGSTLRYGRGKARSGDCVRCQRAYQARYRTKNEKKLKEYQAKHRLLKATQYNKRAYSYQKLYGLSIEAIDEQRARQQFRCKLCNTHEETLKHVLCVDHCHACREVRGLLCHTCNLNNDDSSAALFAKARYIQAHERVCAKNQQENPLMHA